MIPKTRVFLIFGITDKESDYMPKLEYIKDSLHKTCYFVSAVSLILMVILVTIEVILRTITGISLLVTDEFCGYLMVFVAYWGSILAINSGNFVRVSLIYDKYNQSVKRIVDIVYNFIFITIVGIMTFFTYKSVLSSYIHRTISNTIARIPLVYPKGFLLLGLIIMEIYLIVELLFLIAKKGGEAH